MRAEITRNTYCNRNSVLFNVAIRAMLPTKLEACQKCNIYRYSPHWTGTVFRHLACKYDALVLQSTRSAEPSYHQRTDQWYSYRHSSHYATPNVATASTTCHHSVGIDFFTPLPLPKPHTNAHTSVFTMHENLDWKLLADWQTVNMWTFCSFASWGPHLTSQRPEMCRAMGLSRGNLNPDYCLLKQQYNDGHYQIAQYFWHAAQSFSCQFLGVSGILKVLRRCHDVPRIVN